MKINLCPRCWREPSVIQWTSKPLSMHPKILGYEVECYDCGFHSGRCETREEAVAKWNKITEEIK